MSDVVVVLNAGSSSLKFTLYEDRGEALGVLADGQVEGLFTEPRFKAKDGAGKLVGERTWRAGTQLGQEGAVEAIFSWCRSEVCSADRFRAVDSGWSSGGWSTRSRSCEPGDPGRPREIRPPGSPASAAQT
jgi:acetate kinase